MSFLHPVYTDDDLKQLPNKQKRRELSDALVEVLQTDTEVRALLRKKTQAKFDYLIKS